MTTSPDDGRAAGPSPTPAGPCAMVIFGAAGDLTKRKLLPALYNLRREGLLPEAFAVLGVAAREMDSEKYRQMQRAEFGETLGGDVDRAAWDWLEQRLYFCRGDFGDEGTYRRVLEALEPVGEECRTAGNALFYLATPPSFFADVVGRLGAAGMTDEQDDRRWRRVVIEKPFGHDLDSARALNRDLRRVLREDQIYRIDHYLGKETVQNIMVLRFANGIFEPIWNRRYVDHVQISVSETLGVEHRGRYYEEAGALRDMVPNHLFQLLALIAMEPPTSFEADAVRGEKAKILQAIQPLSPEEVLTRTVRGQYGEGTLDGGKVPAYRSEPKVAPDSRTETFVALRLQIDNWRWADVPFYLRVGKRLPARVTEIVIQFKRAPFILFRKTPVDHLRPNQLVLRIQPSEAISLSFGAKVPGPVMRMGDVDMEFCYEDYFGGSPATGYETLLYDCMKGDATLFQRGDNVESAWRVVSPILDVWSALPPRTFPNYAAGTWGPEEAVELLARSGRQWRNPQ
jgi:glucose-6-phosphate 1-dehydrogenase